MMRQSSSRNHRSRGWKVKHVLQICLLVAVCVWLLYQVKHSHDKKRALEGGTLKASDRVEESRPDFLKLGRKDPQESTVVTATDNTAHNEEEEENEETEEAAEQENRHEENEEEDGGGAGDDEIDESDQERADDEAEGGEEFGDEEDKEGRSEDLGLLENGDHEDDEGKSQGAREEHYKADDASSAVVRDTQEINQENGDLGAGNLDEEQTENAEKDELGNDVRANGTEVASKDDEMHHVPTDGDNRLNNSISLNDTPDRERVPEVESIQNSTVVLESTGHIEEHSITTSNSSDLQEQHDNSTIFEPNNQTEQQSNSTEAVPDEQKEAPNSTGAVPDEQKEAQTVSTGNNAENAHSTRENETANLDSSQDQSRVNETSIVTEVNSISENILAEQTEKSNVSEGVEESDESHNASSVTNGDDDAVQGEATNSSSDASTMTEEDQEARTDLSTLPDIQIETRKEEEIAAE